MNQFINFRALKAIYLITGRVDLRKSIDGLAAIVQEQFELDPFQSQLFLFCGRRHDRFKGLYWDTTGFILLYKRIENGHLQWPNEPEDILELSQKQLFDLLSGLSIIPTIKPAASGKLY